LSPEEPSRPGVASHPVAALLATTLSVTLGALPIFLTGAMAVFIRPELGFGETALGGLASVYYVASALMTVPAGRIAERLGGPRAMSLGAAASMISTLGIAALARSWTALAVFLMVAGVGNGLAFPATNLALARGIPARRQGVAFAVKQSAGPYATLLAGAAVPLVALTLGWRWAFVFAGVAAIPIVLGYRVRQATGPHRGGTSADVATRSLWILAAGAFFAVNASASLGAFYVESAVAGGVTAGVAGVLLSAGSAAGILTRVAWGAFADRRTDLHFVVIPAMLGVGAIGFGLLGGSHSTLGLALLTVLVFGTGWAWPSVLNFAVVRRSIRAPGIASGILGTGQFGGGILGPLVFGTVVEQASYRVAWLLAGGMVAVAAILMRVGGVSLERWVDAASG
jgi:MFS family permease